MQWSVPPIGERPHQPMTFPRFPQRELTRLATDDSASTFTLLYCVANSYVCIATVSYI